MFPSSSTNLFLCAQVRHGDRGSLRTRTAVPITRAAVANGERACVHLACEHRACQRLASGVQACCTACSHVQLHTETARVLLHAAYLDALRHKALPFLLGGDRPQPRLLLVCAGYDALAADPLGTMALCPTDYGETIRMVCDDFDFPRTRIALGLEGGYSLCNEAGMPAAVVETCAALTFMSRG